MNAYAEHVKCPYSHASLNLIVLHYLRLKICGVFLHINNNTVVIHDKLYKYS